MLSEIIARTLRKLSGNTFLKSFRNYMPRGLKRWAKENAFKELVSADELKPQYEKACLYLAETIGIDSIGDYLEFGVCHGTSINCMHQVLTNLKFNHVRLIGFNSFEGMPEITGVDDGGLWYPGQFRSQLEETKSALTKKGIDWNKTVLIKGWFSDTLTDDIKRRYKLRKASIIMIDCDIYTSAKEALNFCKSLIRDKCILVFDDWGAGNLAEKNMGEKRAFEEFLKENTHLTAEEFGNYNYNGSPNGRLFIVNK